MVRRLNLFSVFACLLSVTSLSIVAISNAEAATAVVDSITCTHSGTGAGQSDFINMNFTVQFTTAGYFGAWAIDEDKTGDFVAGGNHVAAGSATGQGDKAHTGGTYQYTGYAGVYYMVGTGQVTVVSSSKSTGSHRAN